MKLIFLDLTSPPLSFKCGVDPVTLGLIAGGGTIANLFATDMTNSTNESIAGDQLRAQKAENALNRAYQTEEAEKNRQFQAQQVSQAQVFQNQQRLASQQFQSDQWQRQFNEELKHRFDVPSDINRAVYFSSHGSASGVGGSVSAPSGSSPSPANGSMPGSVAGLSPVPFSAQRYDIPNLLTGISSMLTGVANAKKSGVETSYLEKSMDLNLRNLAADADLKTVTSIGLKLDNYVKDRIKDHSVSKAYYEARKACYDAAVSKLLTGKVENEAALIKSQERLNDVLSKLHDNESQLIALDISTYFKRLNSSLELQSSERTRNYASAAESSAKAKESESNTKLTDLERTIRSNVQGTIEQKYLEELRSLEKQNLISDVQLRVAEYAAEQQRVASEHAEWIFWRDFLLETLQGGTDVFTSIKNSNSWDRMSKASKSNADRALNEARYKYGDQWSEQFKDSRGRIVTHHRNVPLPPKK